MTVWRGNEGKEQQCCARKLPPLYSPGLYPSSDLRVQYLHCFESRHFELPGAPYSGVLMRKCHDSQALLKNTHRGDSPRLAAFRSARVAIHCRLRLQLLGRGSAEEGESSHI